MDYYEIRTIDGKRIEWGIFASDADAVRWYMRGVWEGWLYKKCGSWFNRVHTEATPKTEAQRLAEFKDLEYWPAGVGLTDWVESACAEMLRLDAALADELNNRDVLDKMLTQCITERDQLRAQVERLQGGEPVAWRVRRHDAPKYWIVFLHKPVDALQDPDREVQPLYTPAAPSQEPAAWVPHLVDRADGVKGHYAIGRWNPRGFREVWNLHTHRWAAYSDDVMSLEEADSLLRQITIPTIAAAPSQEPYKDSTPHLSVGESSFESWFSAYNPANKGDKQRARDAYAAGMADPLVAAVPSQPVTLTEEVFGPIVKAAFDAGWAACRASELVGDNAKEFAWDMSGDEITERLIAALRENEALR